MFGFSKKVKTKILLKAFRKWDKYAKLSRKYNGSDPEKLQRLESFLNSVNKLLLSGADVNVRDEDGNTPLLLSIKLEENSYLKEGSIIKMQLIESIISKGADVNIKNKNGDTPLIMSLANQYNEITNLLISRGADVNEKDKRSNTPLLLSFKWSSLDMEVKKQEVIKHLIKLIISKGADVNVKDEDGNTPLILSLLKGFNEIAELLINKGADVNAKDNDGRTPLHITSDDQSKEIAELLISKGADVNEKDNNGSTPLHRAVTFSGGKILTVLLISKGADVNAKDNRGRIPLHNTSFCAKEEIAELLISKGADVNAKDNDGRTPLMIASSLEYLNPREYISLLISKGAVDILPKNTKKQKVEIGLTKEDICSRCGQKMNPLISGRIAEFLNCSKWPCIDCDFGKHFDVVVSDSGFIAQKNPIIFIVRKKYGEIILEYGIGSIANPGENLTGGPVKDLESVFEIISKLSSLIDRIGPVAVRQTLYSQGAR